MYPVNHIVMGIARVFTVGVEWGVEARPVAFGREEVRLIAGSNVPRDLLEHPQDARGQRLALCGK